MIFIFELYFYLSLSFALLHWVMLSYTLFGAFNWINTYWNQRNKISKVSKFQISVILRSPKTEIYSLLCWRKNEALLDSDPVKLSAYGCQSSKILHMILTICAISLILKKMLMVAHKNDNQLWILWYKTNISNCDQGERDASDINNSTISVNVQYLNLLENTKNGNLYNSTQVHDKPEKEYKK